MDRQEGRTRARLAILAEMSHRRWTNTELSRRAGVDINTIGDFLSGARWPKSPTQGRIESALGWPPGSITAVAAGVDPPSLEIQAESSVTPLEELSNEALLAELARRLDNEETSSAWVAKSRDDAGDRAEEQEALEAGHQVGRQMREQRLQERAPSTGEPA
jgi:lambda repressor-like predicted transcriptional regulator